MYGASIIFLRHIMEAFKHPSGPLSLIPYPSPDELIPAG